MSLFNAIDVAATALEAQTVRLNTISSNLANANAMGSDPDALYKAQYPVFETLYRDALGGGARQGVSAGVRVSGVALSRLPARREYNPGHPLADDAGFVYRSPVNSVEEIANMMEASRSYQNSVDAMNTNKQLILRTLTLGR